MKLQNSRLNGKMNSVPVNTDTIPTSLSADGTEVEYLFSPIVFLRVLRRRLWIILVVALMLMGLAVGFSFVETPTYMASTLILVAQKDTNSRIISSPDILGAVQGLQQSTETMARAVETRPVAKAAIERLDLRESPQNFLDNLSADPIAYTQFIEVTYKDPSPKRAERSVNAVGEAFSDRAALVSPSASSITATVWEPAVMPDSPVSPNPVRNGMLALALGVLLGVGLAFLLEYLDDRWRSPEEVEQVTGIPSLSLIPEYKGSETRRLE
jgi:capsular polysaccharide biosynthesis protein